MMQERINELRAVYAGYSGIVEKLYKKAAEQNHQQAMKQLRVVWDRLQQGPIRAMVIGVSSAGKSTMLNALAGNIVVPEGSHTTSPVPVWIYSDGEASLAPDVCVFKIKNQSSLPSAKNNNIGQYAFITDYCYTPIEAARGTAKDKYKDVTAASVNVNVETRRIYESGITFVDTPGIGVSMDDNLRVDDVISGGCEFALVVFRDMTQETTDFLRSQFVSRNAPLNGILNKGRVFAAHNYTEAGTKANAEAHIQNIFGGQLRGNLFMINALYARNSSGGYYNYKSLLPAASRNDLAKEAAKSMQNEKDVIAQVESREDLQALWNESQKELDNLWEALKSGVRELLDKPEELLIPVCGSINGCFRELKIGDAELKQELNKLNQRSFALIKAARSKENEARKADYDARVKVVQSILGNGPDSFLIKLLNGNAEQPIKKSCEAFMKLETFDGYWPIADDMDSARILVYEKIVTEAGCSELVDVIDERMRRMNNTLKLHLSRRYFGSDNIRGMTAQFMDNFAAIKDLIERLDKPISAEDRWYFSGDIDEKISSITLDMSAKSIIALLKPPNLTVRPNMGWYERSLIEACTAAHEKAVKSIQLMNPLHLSSEKRTNISAFLREKQPVAERGGIRGSWVRSTTHVDLKNKFFTLQIQEGIKTLVTQYLQVCKDTLIKEVQENVTKTLLNRLSVNYKNANQRHEAEINSIRKELGI